MTTMASQITSLTVVYPTVYSDADQRKHQSSASLAFVWGIHRDRWIPRTKGQLSGKCFHLMTSSWSLNLKCHFTAFTPLHALVVVIFDKMRCSQWWKVRQISVLVMLVIKLTYKVFWSISRAWPRSSFVDLLGILKLKHIHIRAWKKSSLERSYKRPNHNQAHFSFHRVHMFTYDIRFPNKNDKKK